MGTKNTNVIASKAISYKRKNSRQSLAAFTDVDFEYTGNTNNVNHLIKKTVDGHSNFSQLNFELNLRTYRNDLKFKG